MNPSLYFHRYYQQVIQTGNLKYLNPHNRALSQYCLTLYNSQSLFLYTYISFLCLLISFTYSHISWKNSIGNLKHFTLTIKLSLSLSYLIYFFATYSAISRKNSTGNLKHFTCSLTISGSNKWGVNVSISKTLVKVRKNKKVEKDIEMNTWKKA